MLLPSDPSASNLKLAPSIAILLTLSSSSCVSWMYAAGGLGIRGGGVSVASIVAVLYCCNACCRWVIDPFFDTFTSFASNLAFSNAFSSAALITVFALDMGVDIGGGMGVGLVPVVDEVFLDGIVMAEDDFFLEASLASNFFLRASFSAAASINSF